MPTTLDFQFDCETFEALIDFEAGLRLALSAPHLTATPDIMEIQDSWMKLREHLPHDIADGLQPGMIRMLDAFNESDRAVIEGEQEWLIARLAELRRLTH